MRRIPYDLEDFRGLWTRCYACGNKSDSLPPDHIYLSSSTRNRPILLLEKRSSINTNGKEVRHTSDTGEGAERVLWTKWGYKEGGKSEGGKSASKRKSVLGSSFVEENKRGPHLPCMWPFPSYPSAMRPVEVVEEG